MRDGTNSRSAEHLFGEIPRDSSRAKIDPTKVSYAKRYGFDDVTYGAGYEARRMGRDYERPTVHRTSTTAY